MEANKKLSILLVNHNGLRYLASCLDSIKQFAPPETEIIMADNASTDGSLEFVAREYPWVQVVRSSENRGFSAGNNLAGREATGKFILLLNTDTVLLDPISPAIEWLETHSDYSVLTINMLDGQLSPRACTGRFPLPSRLFLLHSILVPPQQYGNEHAYDVDWVQGSFLLMRAEHWRALGGLDEKYFMYAEDMDLCKKVHDAGLKCAYLPKVRYLHWGGYNPKRFPELIASLDLYISHHMKATQKLISRTILYVGCFARTIFYRVKAILRNDEVCRTTSRASWLAFTVLLRRNPWWRTRGAGS